jgi:hypothetical protein
MMSSSTYQLFRQAILLRKPITCTYRRLHRELCPHVLGHSRGREKALTYQFAGGSYSGLPPGGQWRCLFLADVENVQIKEGPWRTGSSHTRTQVCVEVVEVDVDF